MQNNICNMCKLVMIFFTNCTIARKFARNMNTLRQA